ncbi:MAG: RNA polymerase sporulation sigma factor SigE [Oscillospiraceae bacterium]|nr:RNA polymerase sporulation sigma factor SigE [Oscillospiraceae bacterium]
MRIKIIDGMTGFWGKIKNKITSDSELLELFDLNLINLNLNLNEVFYVNGSETLPPPLSAEEEVDIISRLDGEPSLKTILIERNLRLVVYIAKRFENSGAGIEDLVSIGTIGLMKAINTFKTDKNIKLATYASRCIENEILMYMRKNANSKNEISIDEPLNVDWDGNELLLSDILGSDSDIVHRNIEETEEKKMIFTAMAKLGKREKVIISLRFGLETGKEKTQKEVADILGISQSYISRLEKKIINKLKREIAKLN